MKHALQLGWQLVWDLYDNAMHWVAYRSARARCRMLHRHNWTCYGYGNHCPRSVHR